MITAYKPNVGTYTANVTPDTGGPDTIIECPAYHLEKNSDGSPIVKHGVPVGPDFAHPSTCHGWIIYRTPDPKAADAV
jgi:hypothetical protein